MELVAPVVVDVCGLTVEAEAADAVDVESVVSSVCGSDVVAVFG